MLLKPETRFAKVSNQALGAFTKKSSGFKTKASQKTLLPNLDEEVINNDVIRTDYLRRLTTKFLDSGEPIFRGNEAEDEIIRILKIPPNERVAFQIEKLSKALSESAYFKTMIEEGKNDLIPQCSKELKLEKFNPGDTIFNYGEIGTKFYLIIKGSVNVMIVKEHSGEFTFVEYLLFLKEHLPLIRRQNGIVFLKVSL